MAKGNRKNIALSVNEFQQIKKMTNQLHQIEKILLEPDPHAEKNKEKLYAIKKVLGIQL